MEFANHYLEMLMETLDIQVAHHLPHLMLIVIQTQTMIHHRLLLITEIVDIQVVHLPHLQ